MFQRAKGTSHLYNKKEAARREEVEMVGISGGGKMQ